LKVETIEPLSSAAKYIISLTLYTPHDGDVACDGCSASHA